MVSALTTFYNPAETAFNPVAMSSGTELFAQYLHGLLLMLKPRRILEFGAGYTTSQLLKSLEALRREHKLLQGVVQDYVKQIRKAVDMTDVISMKNANIVHNILRKEHYHYNLCKFLVDYEPEYLILEDGGTEYYLKELNRLVAASPVKTKIHYCKLKELNDPGQFDLLLNDADEYFEFYQQFWDQLAEGGFMIFHQCYENFKKDHTMIMDDMKARGRQFTFMNLQERDKHMQNGCVIYQKVDLVSERNEQDCMDINVSGLLMYIKENPNAGLGSE
jgi:predicted O-methyltransferase YrrM